MFPPGAMVISKSNLKISLIVGYAPIPPQTSKSGREISPASWEALVLSSTGTFRTVFWASLDNEFYTVDFWKNLQE